MMTVILSCNHSNIWTESVATLTQLHLLPLPTTVKLLVYNKLAAISSPIRFGISGLISHVGPLLSAYNIICWVPARWAGVIRLILEGFLGLLGTFQISSTRRNPKNSFRHEGENQGALKQETKPNTVYRSTWLVRVPTRTRSTHRKPRVQYSSTINKHHTLSILDCSDASATVLVQYRTGTRTR